MPELKNVTDPNLPEPKNIASANAGTIYTADGVGSGSWDRVVGWGQYQDTQRSVGTPTQTLSPATRTKFLCDGGFLSITRAPSDQAVPLWDTTNNKIVPIAEYDAYTVRISFWAENYGGTAPYIDIDLDIGGSINDIVWDSVPLNKAGSVVKKTLAFPVFTGDTFFANGGEIYLTYQGTGTCDIYRNDIMILREFRDYVGS